MAEVYTTRHQVLFQTSEPVSARELALSLLGLDGVLKQSSGVISRLTDRSEKISIELLVESIESGSYKENFIIRILFGKGKELEKNIEELRSALGLKKMDAKKIVGLVITGAVLYVAYLFVKPDDPARIIIQNSFNVIGEDAGITGEDLRALFETALGHRKEDLKKSVVQFAQPAKQRVPAKIIVDGQPELTIQPEVVSTLPKDYVKAEPAESFTDLRNAQIMIRALDLDSSEKGWAAVIPSISEKRVKVELSEEIKATRIPVGKYLYADATVFFKVGKNGIREPVRIHIQKLRLNESDPAGSSL